MEKLANGLANYRQNRYYDINEKWVLTMKLNPTISIIICTFNRAQLLRRTLMSLRKLIDIEQAEVIVIDNHSLDLTPEIVRLCIRRLGSRVNLRYVFEPRQGLSIARNTGIQQASAPIVAFLDDDALPYISWVSHIMNAFKRYPRAAAIGGAIIPEFAIDRPDWLVSSLELPYTIVNLGSHERLYPRNLYPFGANMAFRREALQHIQFPEELGRKGSSLLSGEEAWVFKQLRKKGFELIYIPGMTVRHHIPKERLTRDWIKRRYYYQGVSMAMDSNHLLSRIRIVSMIALRLIYISIQSRFMKSSDQLLLIECRQASIRGSLETLRLRDVEPTYE
jgi:glycosyltransferase involved in cell wall biosynthesis